MRIDLITIVPKFFNSFFFNSTAQRAIRNKLVKIYIHDLHMYGIGKQSQIDDYPYSVKGGMILKIEPIEKCLEKLKSKIQYDEIIYLTPDGEIYMQNVANILSFKKNVIILCGHYKGIDQRIRDNFITREISIGNYVLSGGEIAAAVLIDSIIRLIPGVLNNDISAFTDSFQDNLLEPPIYTRPIIYKNCKVPNIILNGNHNHIIYWKFIQSIILTKKYIVKHLDIITNDLSYS